MIKPQIAMSEGEARVFRAQAQQFTEMAAA